MSKNFDLIATVDIDIASPIVDDTSFDNLLILGPAPKKAGHTAPDVGPYSSIEEVTEAGFVVSGDGADPVGVAARVAFAQNPRPTTIYIAIQKTGEDGKLEDPVVTIQRALGMSGWYVLCTAGVDPAEYEAIAEYIETQEKMFCYTELDYFGAGNEGADESYVGDVYFRSFGVYGKENTAQLEEEIPDANLYENVASVAKWLNYESGSETFAFKTLSSVYPSDLTTAEMKALEAGNLNYFVTVGNKNVTMNGKTRGGEWIDVIRFRDWLKNDMQLAVVNLFVTRPKVPYTDSGIALVQNQMIASLKRGQNVGGIAEDEFDEDGNTIPGFVTSVPLASSITASEKASRKLHNCKFKARLAGAIHFAELTGSLTYEL